MSSGGAAVPLDLLDPKDRAYLDRFGGGLVVVLPGQRPESGGGGRGGPPHGGAWVHVAEDGHVRAFTGKVEVGQGTRTALTLLVAEELGLPPSSVDLTMGDTDLTPWDMGTFGSRSMAVAGEHLRLVGAATAAVLRELAGKALGLPPDRVELLDGRAQGRAAPARAVTLGELVRGLRRVELVPRSTSPRPPAEWRRAGHPTGNLGAEEVVTGTRKYTSDLHPPGMLYGRVLFPPTFGARLLRVDLAQARALPGAVAVHEGEFVGVAAPDPETADAALRAVDAEWEPTPQPSERELAEYFRRNPVDAEDSWDVASHEEGDVDAALASAPITLRETYSAAFIAHVPMETHAVLAAWEGERLTAWVGGQTPFRAREVLARGLGIPPERVRVLVAPTGTGFGGKHAGPFVVGAAQLARAAGRPVRIVFTREEEFAHAYFRPGAVIDVRSGAAADGTLTAWEFRVLNAGSAAVSTPYRVANQRVGNQPTRSPLAQGPYRALGATANNFAREVHLDELASRCGADPLEYRLRHLADERVASVLRAVAERAGWSARPTRGARSPTPERGRGIAAGTEKGGRVATYAEVRVDRSRRLEVLRVVTGYECGAIVHPTNLRAQVEGGTVMALGGALFEAVHFDGGRILNPRLSQYRVPRFHDVPPVEVLLLDRPDLPSQGAGETPLIALAPALANAIFDATGTRLRSLPLVPDGVVPSAGVPSHPRRG
jgi:nicotinate dehydrogenase subunit B